MGDRNLASAEPLFDKDEDRCLDSASEFLAAAYAPSATPVGGAGRRAAARMSKEASVKPRCGELFTAIRSVIPARTTADLAGGLPDEPYTQQQRNEIIDALLASSNRKCGRYSAFLKNADGIANVSLSLGSIITGGLGAVVGGVATAKALSGSAAILSGSRAAINEIYLTNQTIHVLTSAFEKARLRQRGVITNREACAIEKYTLMRGIEDAFQYHNACSLVKGLEETVLAVERSDNPGLDAMRKTFAQYAMLVKQAGEISEGLTPTPVAGPVAADGLNKVVELDKQLIVALADVDKAEKAETAKKDEMTTAKKVADAEADPVKQAPLLKVFTKLKTEYMTKQDETRQARWKRDGLNSELRRAAQQLASAAMPPVASVARETRSCPFDGDRRTPSGPDDAG